MIGRLRMLVVVSVFLFGGAFTIGSRVVGGALHDGDGATAASAVADPDGLLRSVNLADSDSLLPLADAAGDAGLIAAAEAALAAGATGDLRWAAVWVVVDAGTNADVLLPFATADDPTIRVMASTGLLARGRVEGFEPLIAALTDETVLVGRYPPEFAWSAATTALVRWTGIATNGPPFDAVASQRVLAMQRWTEWFNASRATLAFNAEEGRWVTS
jgi:hypothetical protein